MKALASLGLAAALLFGVTSASIPSRAVAGPGADQLVGDWRFRTGGAVVRVTGSGTKFVGKLVTRGDVYRDDCPAAVGDVIWKITGKAVVPRVGTSLGPFEVYLGKINWTPYETCASRGGRFRPPSDASWKFKKLSGETVLDNYWVVAGHAITDEGGWGGGSYLDRVSSPPPTPKPTPKPPPPTPKPPPAQPAAGKLTVELEELPERYGTDVDPKDGLVDQFVTPGRINPGIWTALVKVSRGKAACDPDASYSWQVDGRIAQLAPTETKCVFSYAKFKGLGKHRVAVAATSGGRRETGSGTILLKDYLIVGLGDSVGSGEGNPDIGAWGFNPTWVDYRCDRSHHSYQAWTAGWLAKASEKTSVTFVHLACSGAKITSGMLSGYGGLNDPGGAKLPAQVTKVRELLVAANRMPDAVLLSIGANDLGFGPILAFCIKENACFNAKGFDKTMPGKTLNEVVRIRLGQLAAKYRTLGRALKINGIPAGKIYISEYFDPTHNQAGKICTPNLLKVSMLAALFRESYGTISDVEADWAYEEVIQPLNDAVAAAARVNHWNLVPGIAERFATHGYCAGTNRTWIVQLSEAAINQGGIREWVKKHAFWWIDAPFAAAGAMHPNREGHKVIANAVLDVLIDHDINGWLPSG